MAGFFRAYWGLERRIVPGLRSSQYEYLAALRGRLTPRTRWLDTGCGHQLFPTWMRLEEAELLASGAHLTGIDLDREALRRHPGLNGKVFGDLGRLPFRDGCFDLITANMVVEHLEDPLSVLEEMGRVLVPGGSVVLHTVNRRHWGILLARLVPGSLKRWLVARLEGRPGEDVFKTYYRMNSATDIRRLAAAARMEVRSLAEVSGTAVLAALGVLAAPELVWIAGLRNRRLAGLRSNLIATLRKP